MLSTPARAENCESRVWEMEKEEVEFGREGDRNWNDEGGNQES